jgi:translation initiation factor 1
VKKSKTPDRMPTGESEQLKHSPFAALSGLSGRIAPPVPEPSSSAASEPSPRSEAAAKPRGRVVLRRETKHRGGKAVVIVSGFDALSAFDAAAIEALAKECKQRLGCGGTVDGGEIVLQGDRLADVAALLHDKGFRVAGR